MIREKIYPELAETIGQLIDKTPDSGRIQTLTPLISYISQKLKAQSKVNLNFICTHNSRRSQFSQIWAQTAADYYNLYISCFSGGVEVTAFNPRAEASVERVGFRVEAEKVDSSNPIYKVSYSENSQPIVTFSKLYDDDSSPKENFAAVMTCDHADENCPFIPGTEARIPVLYEDPKKFDDTPQESAKYDERSMQIGSEMFYVFSQVASGL